MRYRQNINRAAALLLAILLLILCGCSCASDSAAQKYYVAVIAKATDSDFWHNVQNGVNSASTEYNVTVTFVGPENEEDYLAQNDMIRSAVDDGAQAVVVSAIDLSKTAEAIEYAAGKGVRVVTIDSGVDSDKVDIYIGTDSFEAGRQAGQAAAECFDDGEQIYIGIINYNQSSENGQQREAGLRDYVSGLDNVQIVDVVNVDSNSTSATAGAIMMLEANPQINVLVGINEWMTLGVGYAIENLNVADTVQGIGFDSNVISVGMLETGEMDALIVQNPFAMGYLGVKYAVDLLSDKEVPAELFTSTTIITKENMYEEDNQKILFPFK